ncbi:GDSL-type esterase/lipase family protein [Pelomonas sp. UHG3]|uniref:GDSL-type esterase/lipase family protein n=1 Tax=Roseateles hydrophilus TaxID=2975054 RepID=A0ACC6CAG3_9BURK|nr:GDSL-type esterase/lipase family protein [Pelomonas sp. UHG3]MCY4745319.1 GDSL-type esterase/lipase family protein [Pelomonas sp. UHG3]
MKRVLHTLCLAMLPLTAQSLDLDTGRPAPGWHIAVTDFEGQARLAGERVTVPKPAQPRVPSSRVAARRGDDGAVTLQFSHSWIAQLRWQGGPPLDLNAYLPQGTVEFDLDVIDLAQGGLKFKLGCGKDCERKIPFLFAGRALAGQGRKHLSFALKCFWREGDDFSAVDVPFTLEGTGSGEVRVSRLRLHKAGKPTTACPDYRTQSVTPEPLQESWAVDWWLPRHESKLAEVRAHQVAGRRVDLVFLGDSITQGWEKEGKAAFARYFAPHNAVALGFGGDRTENLLWRLRHGALDGMAPKVVVMLIGTNNTGERLEDPALTVAGIRANLDEIRRRQPQATVLLMALLPRGETPDDLTRRHNARINALLPSLADGQRVRLLDIGPALTQPDGTLSRDLLPDFLHLSPAGYDIWARRLDATLTPLLAP